MKRSALKEHQGRTIPYMLKNPYSIIALDPGLGKSRCAIETREKLQVNCLVICPGYLIQNWVKEIRLWAKKDVQITTITAGNQICEVCDTDYLIVSYDLVQKAEHFFEWADMVILDEAHNIKSMKAKRTQFIHKNIYENSMKRVHLLTGTPIKNRVQEFYSLLALCFYNPHAADTQFLETYPSEIDFADRFSIRQEYTIQVNNRFIKIVKWNGLRNLPELRGHLKNKYIRIKSEDVLDLPPVQYKSMLISNTPNKALLKEFNSFFERDGADSVKPDAKVEAANQKVPFTVKYAKDLLEETDCVLIYTDHVEPAERIAAQLGVKAITGKVSSKVRSQMADAFQAGEGRIQVATIGSMKEGKDLFRSSHIILNDFPWVPGDLKQVIYRIQRMGQKRKCTVHRIIGSPQDEYIMDTIQSKIKVIERAT